MTVASDLLQQHIQTLVDDNAQWQTLIADDICVGTRLRALTRPSGAVIGEASGGRSRDLVRGGCGKLPLLRP